MGETLITSPNPTLGHKRRQSVSTRLQSPTSPFCLESNDDQLERAQARAARAAAIRRKAALDPSIDEALPSDSGSSCLDGNQIMELFRNCIKLASENKINQKNTWELKLIDHLSEIIKVEDEDDAETNFQKASCTLEAGVKIYALRVDSVHSEAYKVLGGISRAGLEDQPENLVGENGSSENDANQSKKETEKKLSPLSTLESSFESLNVKKFDVAFAVDPLYHQTTAQFDEGGAKGLLLNNLGIYGGCRVLFDSQEVPAKCISSTADNNYSEMIDISFASECIDQMVNNVDSKQDICPTFRVIMEQVDGFSLERALFHKSQESLCDNDVNNGSTVELNGNSEFPNMDDNDRVDDQGIGFDDGTHDNGDGWAFDNDDDANFANDTNFDNGDHCFQNQYEEQDSFGPPDPDTYDRFETVASLLLGATGTTTSQNAWAGPEHWKYRKSKSAEVVTRKDSEAPFSTQRPRAKKGPEADIDFTKALDEDMPDIFAPPKSLKSLLLPTKKVPLSNKLPEDCHYQPEDLVKLFLLPNVLCLGKRRRKLSDNAGQEGTGFNDSYHAWDNESAFGDHDNGDYAHSDIEEQDMLVSQPRQVNKIEVQYDKAAKQVDVHLLKETLWNHLHGSAEVPVRNVEEEEVKSFKDVLANFPDDCRAAAPQDISPHLCFICLLHLANEHGLRIQGCESMDELTIHIPPSCHDTGINP